MASTPVPPSEPAPVVVQAAPPSVLDRVRDNRVGPAAVALAGAIILGLLLSVLVPKESNVLALVLLGTILAAAIGFKVRYLSRRHGPATQAIAFVATLVGVHLMAVTGSLNGAGGGALGGLIALPKLGWDDALLAALATPLFSSGAIVAGLVAAIIAGWGPRDAE